MLHLDTVLVPVDFSDASQQALAQAHALAASWDAHLDVLHVIEEPAFPAFYRTGSVALYGSAPDVKDASRQALHQLLEQLPTTSEAGRVGLHVCQGDPSEEILRFAEDHDADLIVIGSQGLTGVGHLLLGSTADKVVRRSPCPVLVTRAEGKSLLGDGASPPADD